MGLGRLADRRAPRAGPSDAHRPLDGAGWQEPHPLQLRVPEALRGDAAQGRHQRLSQSRRGLDRPRQQRRALPVAGSDIDGRARLLRRAVLSESGGLDDGGEQQAADRGRVHAVPLQPDFRPSATGRHHQPDPRHRAVERRQSGHWPVVCAAAELHLSRRPELGMGRRQDRRLAGAGLVCDRRAQSEGRLPGQSAGPARSDHREPDAARLPLQPGRAQRRQLLAPRLRPAHDYEPARCVHPGRLDARPAHAAGRAAIRPRLELCPGGTERHDRHVVPESVGDHHRADARRQRLQRHHGAHGRGVGRVRQREDRHQAQLGPLPGLRGERSAVHVDKPWLHDRPRSAQPPVERVAGGRRQWRPRRQLQPAQCGGQWRVRGRHRHGAELRHGRRRHAGRSGCPERVGREAERPPVHHHAAAASCCRGCLRT